LRQEKGISSILTKLVAERKKNLTGLAKIL